MSKFDLKRISAISGKCPFFQLTIDDTVDFSKAKTEEEKNRIKTGVLDLFEKNLESIYEKDMIQIYNTMRRIANNELVPKEKFRELKGRKKSDPHKEYEFKHGDLRIYATQAEVGKIIVLGGYKNSQEKDIKKMRSRKLQYFDSLKKNK